MVNKYLQEWRNGAKPSRGAKHRPACPFPCAKSFLKVAWGSLPADLMSSACWGDLSGVGWHDYFIMNGLSNTLQRKKGAVCMGWCLLNLLSVFSGDWSLVPACHNGSWGCITDLYRSSLHNDSALEDKIEDTDEGLRPFRWHAVTGKDE